MTTGRWMRSAVGIAAGAALVITALAAPAGAAQGGVTVKQDVTYRTVDGESLALDTSEPAKKGKNRSAVDSRAYSDDVWSQTVAFLENYLKK